VEAGGVELFNVLTARNLIDSSHAEKGEKGNSANSIVRLLYETPARWFAKTGHK
jgi:hypothetical protein